MDEFELQQGRIIRVKGEDVRRVGLPDWDLHFLEGCEDPEGIRRLLRKAGGKVEHISKSRVYFMQPESDPVPEESAGMGDPLSPDAGGQGPEDATG
ncbi:hypothetical protein LCGC14_2861050 [marine sediment metagenome]|uniref:Uncharacterized protein n=1 Tax=marine sediment metagenome TaxID=412755 RepID=A0A0F9AWT2_9ZZZZ